MQQQKLIITGDYIDTTTGVRFLEDVRGNLHCYMGHEMIMPSGGDTINNYEYNNITNNNTEVMAGFDYSSAQLIILHTRIRSFTWPNVVGFHRINNSFSSGFLNYTVPFGKKFHIKSLVCSQHKGNNNEISYIGIFKGMNLVMSIPLVKELNLLFDYPLIFNSSDFIELKFWPYHRNTDLGIMLKGYTL